MAYFVIAGYPNCPKFAMAENVADRLQKNLPNFHVHKILIDKDEWPKWLQKTCLANGWCHFQSPLIWRELVHRGSRGTFVGGVNEFLDYAETYYGIEAQFQTRDLFRIALENQREFEAKKRREADNLKRLYLHRVCVLAACKNTSILVIFEALRNRVFGETVSIIIHLFCHPDHEEYLNDIRNDLFDLACPQLHEVKVFLELDSALKDCDLVLWFHDEAAFFTTSPGETKKALRVSSKTEARKKSVSIIPKRTPLFSENLRLRTQSMNVFLAEPFMPSVLKIPKPSKVEGLLRLDDKTEREAGQRFRTYGTEIQTDNWQIKSRQDLRNIPKILENIFLESTADIEDELSPEDKSLLEELWTDSESNSFTETGSNILKEDELDMFVTGFGELFSNTVKPDCTVIIYGHGNINYLAFLLSVVCKSQGDNILSVDDTEVYARCTLAKKLGVRSTNLSDVRIWGDSSNVLYVDISETTIEGYEGAIWKETDFTQKLTSIFTHWRWFNRTFKTDFTQSYLRQCNLRGPDNVILPLAERVLDVISRWYQKVPDSKMHPISVGVVSDGCYNIPQGFVMTCPVMINNQMWQPLPENDIQDDERKIPQIAKKCLENQFAYLQENNALETSVINIRDIFNL